MTSTSPNPPFRKLIPTTQPISTLPTDTARIYNTFHPVLVLTLYYLTFPFLVSDPVLTLRYSLFPLSILQLGYVVTCLPTSGSASPPPPTPRASKPGHRKRSTPKQNANLSGKVIVSRHLTFSKGLGTSMLIPV